MRFLPSTAFSERRWIEIRFINRSPEILQQSGIFHSLWPVWVANNSLDEVGSGIPADARNSIYPLVPDIASSIACTKIPGKMDLVSRAMP
jgi:hypothetical protein